MALSAVMIQIGKEVVILLRLSLEVWRATD